MHPALSRGEQGGDGGWISSPLQRTPGPVPGSSPHIKSFQSRLQGHTRSSKSRDVHTASEQEPTLLGRQTEVSQRTLSPSCTPTALKDTVKYTELNCDGEMQAQTKRTQMPATIPAADCQLHAGTKRGYTAPPSFQKVPFPQQFSSRGFGLPGVQCGP